MHVGDLYHVDVAGARAAGLTPALLDVGDLYPECDCLRVRSLSGWWTRWTRRSSRPVLWRRRIGAGRPEGLRYGKRYTAPCSLHVLELLSRSH